MRSVGVLERMNRPVPNKSSPSMRTAGKAGGSAHDDRPIRAVIVNNDDLISVTFQGGLNGAHQRVDVFDLVEGRHYDSEFKGIWGQLGSA